jgi:hypothetical protein
MVSVVISAIGNLRRDLIARPQFATSPFAGCYRRVRGDWDGQ